MPAARIEPSTRAVQAARDLLSLPLNSREAKISSAIEALLREMDVGTIEPEYRIVGANGFADYYLPNQRAIFEVKRPSRAADPDAPQSGHRGQSARAQLATYVLAEIRNELEMLTHLREPSTRMWTGVLTNGRHWHVSRFEHSMNAVGVDDPPRVFHVGHGNGGTEGAEALVKFLHDTLEGKDVGKEWVPRVPGELFHETVGRLTELYGSLDAETARKTATKRSLWLDMLRASGMAPASKAGRDNLFVTHTVLIAIARFVRETLFHTAQPDDAPHPLKDGFASWVLDSNRGQRWAEDLRKRVSRYDWRRRQSDVLRDLYHDVVSSRDRRIFGEFYTPDWLAALMVEEVLDDPWIERSVAAALEAGDSRPLEGVGVFDPTCGSGTFLYHAARRLLAHPAVKGLHRTQQADVVAQLVHGMDIHPIAVEIARVTLLRALPDEPRFGESALRIYIGDSLQTPVDADETLFSSSEDYMVVATPGKEQLLIPRAFVDSPNFAEGLRQMVNSAAGGYRLPGHLKTAFPDLVKCHEKLVKIIEKEGNSVWTWYVTNMAMPLLLAARKINRIVANPPYVKLSEIQANDRKKAMERLGRQLHLQAGGKMAPHLDIASFFVLQARNLYMDDPDGDPAAWLVLRGALTAGQWAPFRAGHEGILAQSVDLAAARPFGNSGGSNCCILMEHRPCRLVDESGAPRIMARPVDKRQKPKPRDSWPDAKPKLEFLEAPPPLPQAPSDYLPPRAGFHNGATIFPHVFTIIETQSPAGEADRVNVTTKRSKRGVWADIPKQSGDIPAHWVMPLYKSKGVFPFIPDGEVVRAIIPVNRDGHLHTGRQAHDKADMYGEMDEEYRARAGQGTSNPKTLLERLDFQGALSRQLTRGGGWMVVHPKSGSIMRAARMRADGVVDNDMYWLLARNDDEAGYLVSILNARCLRRAFADAKKSERHFDLEPWREVPIPRYDGGVADHLRLARLCASAEQVATDALANARGKRMAIQQRAASTEIRAAVYASKPGREIEDIVKRLLPHVST